MRKANFVYCADLFKESPDLLRDLLDLWTIEISLSYKIQIHKPHIDMTFPMYSCLQLFYYCPSATKW